eukprot:584629-Amphidinium_carterae.1
MPPPGFPPGTSVPLGFTVLPGGRMVYGIPTWTAAPKFDSAPVICYTGGANGSARTESSCHDQWPGDYH